MSRHGNGTGKFIPNVKKMSIVIVAGRRLFKIDVKPSQWLIGLWLNQSVLINEAVACSHRIFCTGIPLSLLRPLKEVMIAGNCANLVTPKWLNDSCNRWIDPSLGKAHDIRTSSSCGTLLQSGLSSRRFQNWITITRYTKANLTFYIFSLCFWSKMNAINVWVISLRKIFSNSFSHLLWSWKQTIGNNVPQKVITKAWPQESLQQQHGSTLTLPSIITPDTKTSSDHDQNHRT